MSIFFNLLLKLVPLYITIGFGFIGAKYLNSHKQTIADLMIYIITPLVIFYGTITAQMTLATLILPLMMFIICCLLAGIAYLVGTKIWGKDSMKNIFAFTSGCGNSGYFGIPLAVIILGEKSFSLAVLASLGIVIYQHSVGYYITAKGQHTSREAFLRVIKLPTLYAFILGLILNFAGLAPNDLVKNFLDQIKSTYSVLGMMIVGMGLATVQKNSFDFKFIGSSFISKFVVWPAVISALIYADLMAFHFFSPDIHRVMLVMSIVPLAADTVVFSTKFHIHPEKASLAVMLSTLFALIYIPIFSGVFIK